MKYDDILSALQQASGFYLYRLRAMRPPLPDGRPALQPHQAR